MREFALHVRERRAATAERLGARVSLLLGRVHPLLELRALASLRGDLLLERRALCLRRAASEFLVHLQARLKPAPRATERTHAV